MLIQLGHFRPIAPFQFKWAKATERFDRGWEGTIYADGRRVDVKHGIGTRRAFGRSRVRAVTWMNNRPAVEGVEADDYSRSRALLSVLRSPDGKHCRADSDVPAGYAGFRIVVHRDELDAKRSPRSLAVKVVEDDFASWAVHAVIRAASFGWLSRTKQGHRDRMPQPAEPQQASAPPPRVDRRVIVDALLRYGARASEKRTGPAQFTQDQVANELIYTDPFAFLLAVIFDQGVVSERAWEAPNQLKLRIGHLDPARIAADPEPTIAAVRRPPALHRYVGKMPGWIVAAAKQVQDEHGGDAGSLWSDRPTARQLQRRLEAFKGIGQKKAAMAVEILERDLKTPIRDMKGSDVAYDVHIRRVFLRTGLADRDDLDHMVAVARELHPMRPGAFDAATWRIGRDWCRPGTPNCDPCPLAEVCPRLIYRANGVRGA